MQEHRPTRNGIAAAILVAGFVLSLPAVAQDVQYVEPPKPEPQFHVAYYELPKGDRPHDVAPAPDGSVWYTGQGAGVLGRLDPKTGDLKRIPLGKGSAPHGVIIGPDGAAWATDGGLNAIVRVDPLSLAVKSWPLPKGREDANLNTAAFDGKGRIWFTGQAGIYGRLDPGDRGHAGLGCAARARALRHRRDAFRRYLVRLAGGQLPGQARPGDGRRHPDRALTEGERHAPRLVGLQGPPLGQRMERRFSERL